MDTDTLSSDPSTIVLTKSAELGNLSTQSSHYPVVQLSQESVNSSSITDSDSVASFSESDQGSFSDFGSSYSTGKSFSSPSKADKDSPEIRAVHNVSEQFRRKYLKSCFDNLQQEVVVDSNPKASHLLILTSGLDIVHQVREKESQLRRENERLLEEQRQLERRLDEVIRELQAADPDFDISQVLSDLDVGGTDNIPLSGFDRQDIFQIEETVEVITPSQSRKRPLEDIIDESDAVEKKHLKMVPALPVVSSIKKAKKGKGKGKDIDEMSATSSVKSDEATGASTVTGVSTAVTRTFLPLLLIDEPDDGSADPDIPPPVSHIKMVPVSRKREILTANERKKLAAEKGMPLHLAHGIPTLPGNNYWSQSLMAFPMLCTTRLPLWNKRVDLMSEPPRKMVPVAMPRGRPSNGRFVSKRDLQAL